MSRTTTATEQAALASPACKTYIRTTINNLTLAELSGDPTYDPFMSGNIHVGVDQPVQTATFTFHLGRGNKSLSPYLSGGLRDEFGTGPAIVEGGAITVSTASSLEATGDLSSVNWRHQFDGRIDTVEMDTERDTLTIRCRDIFAELQDHQIDNLSLTDQGYQYGFVIDAARVDVAMQQIIQKALVTGAVPTIFVRGTPTLSISSYWQEYMGVLDACRRIGTLTCGWDLRGRWDTFVENSFTLTYYEPANVIFVSDTVYVPSGDAGVCYTSLKAASSIINVRNVCDVIPANDLRVPQRIQVSDSINKYGRRHAGLSEDISSHIDTDAEALALAQIMADQLSTPSIDLVMNMPYYWLFQLNDTFQPGPDGYSYDADHVFSVSSIDHNFGEEGDYTTSVGGSLVRRAAVGEWMRGRKRRNQVRLGEPAGPGFEGDVWFMADDLTIPTVL